jgi:hypothetical protein
MTNPGRNNESIHDGTYKAVLVCFMSFLNDHEYDKEYEFSQEELVEAVNPINIKKHMCP